MDGAFSVVVCDNVIAAASGNSRCGFAAAVYEIFVKFFGELFAK